MAMDYYGQKRAHDLGHGIIILSFLVGTIVGFWKQNLMFSVYGWVGGLAFTLVFCVPAWPWFSMNPVKWQSIKKKEE